MERLNYTSDTTAAEMHPLSGMAPVTLRDVAYILRRRAGIALLTFAVTVAVTLAVTSRMTPTYEATSKILLDNAPTPGLPSSVIGLIGGSTGGSADVEVAKIKSRAFLSEIIRRMGIEKITTTEDLGNRLNATTSANGQILEITAMFKKDPKLTANVANTAAEVYKEYVRQDADHKLEVSQERFIRARDKAEKEKDVANAALFDFMKKRGVSDPSSYYIRRANKTMDIKNALEDSLRDIPLKQKRIALLTTQVNTISPEIITSHNQDKNGQIQGFQNQVVELEYEKRVKLLDFGPESPEIVEINKKIDAAKKARQDAEANAYSRGSVGVGRNPDYQSAVSNLYAAKFDLETSQRNIAALSTQLAALEAEQRKLAPESVEFQELKRRADITSEAYQKATTALITMPINRFTDIQNIKILEPAKVPDRPISPKPLLNLAMALFGGTFLALAVAIGTEYFTTAPRPTEGHSLPAPAPNYPMLPPAPMLSADLPLISGVPLLARVPMSGSELPVSNNGGLPAASHRSASAEDAFREIGYILAHKDNDAEHSPVVVLAGTRTDETTASIAAYLTATLVRDGLRITLIDADSRQPRLNRVFGKPDAPGMTDILAGRVKANEAMHLGASGNLRFLAAGSKEETEAITEEPLRRLFDELAQSSDTDLVIVSAPSVWSARLLSPMERAANGLVLVASDAQVAPEESVARARRILSNGYQPRLLGVVIGERQDNIRLTEPAITSAKKEEAEA